jgi:hypothetical protein
LWISRKFLKFLQKGDANDISEGILSPKWRKSHQRRDFLAAGGCGWRFDSKFKNSASKGRPATQQVRHFPVRALNDACRDQRGGRNQWNGTAKQVGPHRDHGKCHPN